MRFARPWHVVVVLTALAGVTRADVNLAPSVPDWAPGPAVVAVTPFENHVPNGRSFEWLVAGAPFEIAMKTQAAFGLDLANPPLWVIGEAVPPEADTVAAFGARQHARYVITGWFDKVGEDLRIAMLVWKIDPTGATVVADAKRQGAMPAYHALLGGVIADAWQQAKVAPAALDDVQTIKLDRVLAKDIYPVFMLGRGLGYLTGAIATLPLAPGTPDLKTAEHDLERAVFLDPKLGEAQRVLGELYVLQAPNDAKATAKAAAKFNYAADLAPDDVAALRAAAMATAAAGKWEPALELFLRLVTKQPWDLDAREKLGESLWQLGDAKGAERQLEQVTAHRPDDLVARRVLVLIHAARSDTRKLVTELEAIAKRAPDDLDTRSDLAAGYAALGDWPKAIAALETVAKARPGDLALALRVGDAYRRHGELDQAIAWYVKAAKLAPESSAPGFAIAQAEVDAGKLADANRMFTNLQKFPADIAAAEHDLGVVALLQNRANDAAWYLRKAAREAPRVLATRRAVAAAELARKDAVAALAQLTPALAYWPDDPVLHSLAGLAHALAGDSAAARAELRAAPSLPAAQTALSALDANGTVALAWQPALVRPWGDTEDLAGELVEYARLAEAMANARGAYQKQIIAMLGAVGKGPMAPAKAKDAPRITSCPVDAVAPAWAAAQQARAQYERLGSELEASFKRIVRHDELGLTAGLLPNARLAVASAKHSFRLALADAGELRGELGRGVTPELRAVGCSDKLLAAALADPARYHVIEEDKPELIPAQTAPRAKPRTTFFVDNTGCPDPVVVWIDGKQLGEVAPGRHSALVADGGERSLCLVTPGSAQCGDRGTVRQISLHDGWSVVMQCP
ncbi:MAG TPA: tetratricopeptide repeat protein, partial [Kofleriaceae bacterium]|nr:tetratricopeptide repeat protein [Kofleriaceae bacterium]